MIPSAESRNWVKTIILAKKFRFNSSLNNSFNLTSLGFSILSLTVFSVKNKADLKKVGQTNKEFVEINYNWKDIVDRTEEVYGCVKMKAIKAFNAVKALKA